LPPSARVFGYDVAIEESELGFESAGPLFERYTVGLTGRLDRRWVESYRKLIAECSSFSGFRLEPAVARVSFVCRASEGPVAVMAMMKKLEELLARANRSATAAASVTPTRGAAETDEETDRAATGFLARATRTRSG
jgi:hypothetical protein